MSQVTARKSSRAVTSEPSTPKSIYREEYKRTREWFAGLLGFDIETPKLPDEADSPWHFVPSASRIVGPLTFVHKSNPLERLDKKRLRTSVDKPGHYCHLTFAQIEQALAELHRHVVRVELANKQREYGETIPWRSRGRPPLGGSRKIELDERCVPVSMFAVLLPRGDPRIPIDMDYRSIEGDRPPTIADLEPGILKQTVDEFEFSEQHAVWLPPRYK